MELSVDGTVYPRAASVLGADWKFALWMDARAVEGPQLVQIEWLETVLWEEEDEPLPYRVTWDQNCGYVEFNVLQGNWFGGDSTFYHPTVSVSYRVRFLGSKRMCCFIATATFGTELSPEVQFLRWFRDSVVLSTFAGGQFMRVFDAWYYSFSPSMAGFVASQPLVKAVMKGVLYPLIGILRLSSMAYSAFAFSPELGVIVAGLVASSLIGVAYCLPPTAAVLMILKRSRRAMLKVSQLKWLAILWLVSVVLIFLGEVLVSPMIVRIATSAFVLSTLSLSALSVAVKFASRFA